MIVRIAVILLLGLVPSSAQEPQAQQRYGITYRLSMTRPASHLFEVAMDVRVPATDDSRFIDLQMPRWQPGRYSVADFAKNVQEFAAHGESRPLAWDKIDDQTWRVQTAGHRTITATYKVFGNDLSGTYGQLDSGHANFNGGEIFLYVAGHKSDAVELHIQPPPNWRIINGSSDRWDQRVWKYPNYEILIDNPTEIGPDWTLDEFRAGGKTYRVMVHSRGDEGGRRPAFVGDIEKVVRAILAMWGGPDFETYTFMFHFAADDRPGDGMEHLTSTQIIESGILAQDSAYYGAVATAAHEFFHVWNLKRLRPVELGPWDWTRPVATLGLWIGEGITQYYGNKMYYHAGFEDSSEFLSLLSRTIDTIENSPASKSMSAEASSMAAPFIDGALHRQRTNLSNTSLSYYLKGELVALNLDLTIRAKTNGRQSLDDVMRRAYEEFYVKSPAASYYLKGRGYTAEDFTRIVSEVAGTDMRDFFARYVRGVDPLPYDETLAAVGLRLIKTPSSLPYNGGLAIDSQAPGLRLGALRTGSPAERAGLQQGDTLLSIGGNSVARDNWIFTLNRFKQGDRVPVTVRRFGQTLTLTVELGPPEIYDYDIQQIPNASAEARRLRAAWLGN